MPSAKKSLGQVNYEACYNHTNLLALEAWDQLNPITRARWEDAANMVVNAYTEESDNAPTARDISVASLSVAEEYLPSEFVLPADDSSCDFMPKAPAQLMWDLAPNSAPTIRSMGVSVDFLAD